MFLILAICWLEALWVYLLVLISEDTWKQVTDLFHPNNEGMINVDIIFVTLQVGIRTLTPTYICAHGMVATKSIIPHGCLSPVLVICMYQMKCTGEGIEKVQITPQVLSGTGGSTILLPWTHCDLLSAMNWHHDNSTSYRETRKPAAYFPRLVHISQKSQTQAVGHNFQKVYHVP